MIESFAGLAIVSVFSFWFVALAVAYIGLRIRDSRAEQPDPELGLKAGLYFFMNAGILLALSGATMSVSDLLGDAFDNNKKPQQQIQPPFGGGFGPGFQQPPPRGNDGLLESVSQRIAWPLVISGLLTALISLAAIRLGTNDARYPTVRRTFTGWRLTSAGMSAMGGLIALNLLFFEKNQANLRPYGYAIGVLAVWLPTLAIQVFLMKSYSALPYFSPPKPKKKRDWDEDREPRRESEDEDDRPRRPRKKPREEEKDAD